MPPLGITSPQVWPLPQLPGEVSLSEAVADLPHLPQVEKITVRNPSQINARVKVKKVLRAVAIQIPWGVPLSYSSLPEDASGFPIRLRKKGPLAATLTNGFCVKWNDARMAPFLPWRNVTDVL